MEQRSKHSKAKGGRDDSEERVKKQKRTWMGKRELQRKSKGMRRGWRNLEGNNQQIYRMGGWTFIGMMEERELSIKEKEKSLKRHKERKRKLEGSKHKKWRKRWVNEERTKERRWGIITGEKRCRGLWRRNLTREETEELHGMEDEENLVQGDVQKLGGQLGSYVWEQTEEYNREVRSQLLWSFCKGH